MRIAAGIALALVATSAQAECVIGTNDVLELTDWSAEMVRERVYSAEIEYRNTLDRGFRMVEGAAFFHDALGRRVALLPLDPDLTLAPDAEGSREWSEIMDTANESRLATVSPADISAEICVWSVVYEDGTVEEFAG